MKVDEVKVEVEAEENKEQVMKRKAKHNWGMMKAGTSSSVPGKNKGVR